MASIDWKKATTQYAGAMKKHLGRTERVSGNHSNPHIDPQKSHLNVYIGADDYQPMLDAVKRRVREIDAKYPPKRNKGDKRITCILLETPVPQEIAEQGRAVEFLEKAHQTFVDFFGAENVGGTCGHLDEQHFYTDKDGKERLSLIHGHTVVAAYAEWREKTGEIRQGINGKHFVSKTRLTALNNAISAMCVRDFGIEYNTADTPQRKSVETLKRETAAREELGQLRKQISAVKADLTTKKKELTKLTKVVNVSGGEYQKIAELEGSIKPTWGKNRVSVDADALESTITLARNALAEHVNNGDLHQKIADLQRSTVSKGNYHRLEAELAAERSTADELNRAIDRAGCRAAVDAAERQERADRAAERQQSHAVAKGRPSR